MVLECVRCTVATQERVQQFIPFWGVWLERGEGYKEPWRGEGRVQRGGESAEGRGECRGEGSAEGRGGGGGERESAEERGECRRVGGGRRETTKVPCGWSYSVHHQKD